MSTILETQLPQYHPGQKKVFLKPKAPIVISICGTKWGKTWGGSRKSIFICNANPGRHVWWVAPTYEHGRISRTRTFDMLWPNHAEYRQDIDFKEKDPAEIRWNQWLRCGQIPSIITYKSADIPDSCKGWGPTEIFGDEAAMWDRVAFTNLVTTTTQTKAQMWIFTTPKGKGTWLHEYWKRGWRTGDKYDEAYDNAHKYPMFYSFRLPTTDNPTVDPDRVEAIKQTMSERLFAQEYLAQWIDEGGVVFPFSTLLCCLSPMPRPVENHVYVVGWDPALSEDESAYSVLDVTNWPFLEVECGVMPFGCRWERQWEKISELSRKYNRAVTAYDDTGGSAKGTHRIELKKSGIQRVIPVDYAGHKPGKNTVINNLIYLMENKAIKLQKNRTWQDQMDSYLYKISDSHNMVFYKPKNGSDDMIDARAVAAWVGMKINPRGQSIEKVRESRKILTWREIKAAKMKEMINSTKRLNHDYLFSMLLAHHIEDPEAFLKDPEGYRMKYEEESLRATEKREEFVLCR